MRQKKSEDEEEEKVYEEEEEDDEEKNFDEVKSDVEWDLMRDPTDDSKSDDNLQGRLVNGYNVYIDS